jgi:uncharacterized protein YbjT (DUF2867 family)
MKIVLAGAYGHLGGDILKALESKRHDIVALDFNERPIEFSGNGTVTFKACDVTKKEMLSGLCDGADMVISTVGLTKASKEVTSYDIDLNGNLNILEEAKKAGVPKFVYISVIHADEHPEIPLLDAKAKFEKALKESGLEYIIYRPTGYFYDIVHVLKPMVDKGAINLLSGKPGVANVIATEDFADYIADHLDEKNKTISIGGTETYNYDEISQMCFEAANKTCVIKRAPAFLFDILIFINTIKKTGKADIIKFSKFTLTGDLVGEVKYGKQSFAKYIKESFS